MSETILTAHFLSWFEDQPDKVKAEILGRLEALEIAGPSKGRPLVDSVENSVHSNLKELRFNIGKTHVMRVYFAYDPQRNLVVLTGGNKIGDGRFYKRMNPIADKIYSEHLKGL